MNKHTRDVLKVLKEAKIEIDSEALEDALTDLLVPLNVVPEIDQKELHRLLVKHLTRKAKQTANKLIGMMQQIYNL